jgi:hypothetical protein
MDWDYIEKVLKVKAQSVGSAVNEILDSLTHLESELGRTWIEKASPNASGPIVIASLVEFDKCLRITEVIEGGNVLKRKLFADFQSEENKRAMSEARVAIHLVSSRAKVKYEPQLPGEAKKPDLLAAWDDKQVAFEVTKLELSAQNVEQWQKRQTNIAKACSSIFKCGSLDIYITEIIITQQMEDLILKAIRDLVSTVKVTDYYEHQISETIYLVYDPTGSIRKDRTNAPTPTKDEKIGACIQDVKADRSGYIKKKLRITSPMPAVAHISSYALPNGYRIPKIVRIYRVATDWRVMNKVIEESTQLSANIPGVVVIDMSSTTAHPHDWASEISRMFRPKLYTKMSAAWLRSGVIKDFRYEWIDYLITNPYATKVLENAIVKRVLPSGQEVKLSNE